LNGIWVLTYANVSQAVNLLQRARNLGIDPNTIMYNTAISALGKSYHWEAAEELFQMIPCPDTISYETMIAAYGLAGQIEKSESIFTAMLNAGHVPRDYAFCGLIAAYRSASNPLIITLPLIPSLPFPRLTP
jgi:pentatricopeptide repeat protein